jgi:cyclic 2,3-diphosphoglycerate synthetase
VAALLIGGQEKLNGTPSYGVPLVHATQDVAASMVDAARRHGATDILDLSDEPVLSETGRISLISHALAAGLTYSGPGFRFDAEPRIRIPAAALALIGTGKRIGKTSVSGHVSRVLDRAGYDPTVVAMGRGGPADPEYVARGSRPTVHDLLARSAAGQHAASDFLEDAVLTGVSTVGARRCGGGLLGTPYTSNVPEAALLAAAQNPGIVVLEGSGAAIPPVAADRTILIHPAWSGPLRGFNEHRLLISDLVVVTMCEPEHAHSYQQIRAQVAPRPVVLTVLRPRPSEPVAEGRVAFFTTARTPGPLVQHLKSHHDADIVAVSTSLSDRSALRRELDSKAFRSADTYLLEIKAAAIDVVAAHAVEHGKRIVVCDNRPEVSSGEDSLDDAILCLASAAIDAAAKRSRIAAPRSEAHPSDRMETALRP